MNAPLSHKTIVMSGGSRGIGLAIALRAAADGANIVLIAKTDTPHPKLTGTIHTAAEQIEASGGRALPVVGDIRSEDTIEQAVRAGVATFGGIDICINNASVLNLAGTLDLEPRRYDLMQSVNARGTFLLSRACLPHLLQSPNPHILTLSPPLNLHPRWLGANPGYMIAKYGMTLGTLGLAAEFAKEGVAANCLWPRTSIATDAVANTFGRRAISRARMPAIMADAAYAVISRPSREMTGQMLIDDEVLREHGITDLSCYAAVPGTNDFDTDIFLDTMSAD